MTDKKVLATEMRFIKQIKGCTRDNCIMTENIKKELKVYNINDDGT